MHGQPHIKVMYVSGQVKVQFSSMSLSRIGGEEV